MLVEVHRELLVRRYWAPKISCTNFYCILINVCVILLTLLITFATQGLWRRTNTYLEQPLVEFSDRFILIISDRVPNKYRFWNAYTDIQLTDNGHLAIPSVRSRHIDKNADGKADEILIDIDLRFSMDKNESFNVHTVFYLLKFKLSLDYRAQVQMHSYVFGQVERIFPGESVFVMADLRFAQRNALPSHGVIEPAMITPSQAPITTFDREDAPVEQNITENVNTFHLYDSNNFINNILQQNFYENYTIQLERKTESWRVSTFSHARESSSHFGAHFRLAVHEQVLVYRAGALELLKWAWLQYLGIFFLVRHAAVQVNKFLFENRILPTITRENANYKSS